MLTREQLTHLELAALYLKLWQPATAEFVQLVPVEAEQSTHLLVEGLYTNDAQEDSAAFRHF